MVTLVPPTLILKLYPHPSYYSPTFPLHLLNENPNYSGLSLFEKFISP